MDTPPLDDPVAAVVALKTLPAAKSRMSPLPTALRERLAHCLALDTLAALAAAVNQVLVISDQPDLPTALSRHGLQIRVIAEPGPAEPTLTSQLNATALNRALAYGDARLRAEGFPQVMACVGDLPALRPATVRRVLMESAQLQRCFVADHGGSGTTMLIARRTPLDPLFGTMIEAGRSIGSATRHLRSGALPVTTGDIPQARWDVDTIDDLRVAHGLGLGPLTNAMVDPVTGVLGAYRVVQVLDRDGQTITVQGRDGVERVALQAYDGDPAQLTPGRRLHAVRAAGGLNCWS